tara:strand:+ start:7524 stop:7649 length:126 start_codon:yes stop_codon:yes gene_type:complete
MFRVKARKALRVQLVQMALLVQTAHRYGRRQVQIFITTQVV